MPEDHDAADVQGLDTFQDPAELPAHGRRKLMAQRAVRKQGQGQLQQCPSQLQQGQSQLQQCQSDLASCQATDSTNAATGFLFVQNAASCTVQVTEEGGYIFSTTDMDPDTYVFQKQPWRYVQQFTTDFYFSYLFDQIHNGSFPANAAVTFSDDTSYGDFNGPLVAVMVANADLYDRNGSTTYVYDLQQTPEQENLVPLSLFFEHFLNESINASVTFQQCTIMIDPPKTINLEGPDIPASLNNAQKAVAVAGAKTSTTDFLGQ